MYRDVRFGGVWEVVYLEKVLFTIEQLFSQGKTMNGDLATEQILSVYLVSK